MHIHLNAKISGMMCQIGCSSSLLKCVFSNLTMTLRQNSHLNLFHMYSETDTELYYNIASK